MFIMFISSDSRRKRTKEDCYPKAPSKGMQPLLLSLFHSCAPTVASGKAERRYAQTIKGLACFFATMRSWSLFYAANAAFPNTMLKHLRG